MLPHSPARRRWPLALVGVLLLTTSACQLAKAAVDVPSQMLGGGAKAGSIPPSAVQIGVMRFADTFASQITQAARDFADKSATPEARIQAMSWTVGQCTAAFTIATGPNPHANMLDMLVLVTLGRVVHEEHYLEVWGESDRPMLVAFQELEEEIWTVARQLLSPEQQEAVRATMKEWHEKNPDMGLTAFVRLPAFQDVLAASGEHGKDVFGELTRLVSLDPLSGLEPTVREIEQTRQFAERTLFYLQRVPLILPVQAELLGLTLTGLPAVESALGDTERISHAATSLAATAATLPEVVRAEREAAVQQVSDELTRQRQGLLHDLETAQAPTQQILGDARATLAAGTEMSTALQGAIQALDAFIGGFRKEPTPEAESAPSGAAPGAEPSKPFDIADYGDAATRIGTAAGELTRLVATLDQSLPQAQRLMNEVAERGERTLDHAFQRGLACGTILIAAAAGAVLLVRRISVRWSSGSRAIDRPLPPTSK